MRNELNFRIVQSDIAAVDADVLVLKYAQAFYGADAWMASTLQKVGVSEQQLQPAAGQYALLDTHGTIQAACALFVGTPSLLSFGYEQIYDFGRNTLAILSQEKPSVRRIALTLHGVGFGLDEDASLRAELAGLQEGWLSGKAPAALETILLVERNASRAARLEQTLAQYIVNSPIETLPSNVDHGGVVFLRPNQVARESGSVKSPNTHDDNRFADIRPHAFVAMPFNDAMEDVFYFGIQAPVHSLDLLCERMDHIAFTGGIVEQMKSKIESASVVVAVLTGNNPNVYLEVGFAWGKGVPTILVTSSVEELAFDVKGSRCLTYTNIKDLAQKLSSELQGLQSSGQLANRRK